MSTTRRRSTPAVLYRLPLFLAMTLALLAFAGCNDAPPPTPTAVPTLAAAAPQTESQPTAEEAATEEPAEQPAAEEPATEAAPEDATPEAEEADATTPEAAVTEETGTETQAESTVSATEQPEAAGAETPEPEATEPATTDDAAANEIDANALNTWNVAELYGLDTLGGVTVTVQLVSDEKLTGWTGCNDFEAAYTSADGAFELTDFFLTSENECSSETETAQEKLFEEAMRSARSYELNGAELTLSAESGEAVAVLRNAVTLDLIGTTWSVTGYRDASGSFVPPVEDGPVLTLSLLQDAVNGFSGCANFQGTAEVSGDAVAIDNLSYDVTGLGSQPCDTDSPLSAQDAEYRKALTTAATWQIDVPHLTLAGEDGEPVVTFLPAGVEQSFLQ